MYNSAKVSDNMVTFVQMELFLEALIGNARKGSREQILEVLRTKSIVFTEPELFEKYNKAFVKDGTFGFGAEQLSNYLNYRLLRKYRPFIPVSS